MSFVHLHNHSHFSLLDASSKIEDMIKRVKELDMKAVALTDHGNMSGAVQLWKECKKENVKSVIGCELYVATQDHKIKRKQAGERNYHHLVVWVKDKLGYKNLCKLVSTSYLEGFYYKPRVDIELLKKYSGGLIASTACLMGSVPRALLFDKEGTLEDNETKALKKASKLVKNLQDIFEDRLYLELQDHGIDLQWLLNLRLMKLSQATNTPLIWTNDCHFLYPEEYTAHKALKCIPGYKRINDPGLDHVYLPTHHFRSEESMRQILSEKDGKNEPKYKVDIPILEAAFDRTAEIAGSCDFSFTSNQYFFPEVIHDKNESITNLFRSKVIEGFKFRASHKLIPLDKWQAYYKRLLYEMNLISDMGFESYFLIIADIVQWAKAQDIMTGPGRGSAAGSLVSWCLQIVDLDPIKHKLMFERFLNPGRVSMPDIDLDFSKRDRHKIIDYVINKYNRDNVAQIITFHTLAPRRVLNDLGRVFGLTIPDAQRFASLIPETPGKPYDLERAYNEIEAFKQETKTTGVHVRIFDAAKKLEDVNRHAGIHAAGLVITPEPVDQYGPLFTQPGSSEVAVGYDMRDLETIGLIKMDILGLKTLDVIGDTIQLIKQRHNKIVDWNKISLEDPEVYKLFAAGKTKGIFQFESRGMRADLIRQKPSCFEHIIAMNALYRPGPVDSGMTEMYIRRKCGEEAVESFHPAIQDIVLPTYGVLVFQEQVIEAISKLAGYDLGQADLVRKAMGKKDPLLMKEELDKFVKAAVSNGFPKREMEEIGEAIKKFSRYGFNRSHSASYAYIAYQTAWLLRYYPIEFYTAILTAEAEDNKFEKIREYIGDAKQLGIKILPPNVNYSKSYFSIEKNSIRYGLAAIKGIGFDISEELIKERNKNGHYKSLLDLLYRLKPGKALMDPLIYSGATECLAKESWETRSAHIENYPLILKSLKKNTQASGQVNLLDLTGDTERIRKDLFQLKKPVKELDIQEILNLEKEVIGFWLTKHPLENYSNHIKDDIKSLRDAVQYAERPFNAELACVITDTVTRKTRMGKSLLILSVEDLSDESDEVKIWGDEDIDTIKDIIVKGAVVKLKGRAGKDKTGRFQFNVKTGIRLDVVLQEMPDASQPF